MAVGKKQKETEALIIERNREIEALARRINELETVIANYKEREESIAEAITSAIETKSSMIKEASVQSKQIVDEANAKASQIRAKAKLSAGQIKEEADKTLESARKEAAALVESAQAEAKRRLDEAYAKADECEKNYSVISSGLMDMALKLNDFIGTVRASFDMARSPEGKGTQALIRPNGSTEIPDNYQSPSELYHSIMAIQGRTAPNAQKRKPDTNRKKTGQQNPKPASAGKSNGESGKAQKLDTPNVSFETINEKLLTTDDITKGIENITNIGSNSLESEKLEAIVREVITE